MLISLLNIYVLIAVFIFLAGVSLNLGRWFYVLVMKRRFKGVTQNFEGGPKQKGLIWGIRSVLFDPIRDFYKKANPTWSRGYMLYHIAIVTKSISYGLATVIVLFHIAMNNPIPDVGTHAEASFNYAPGNVAAIIFGCGEDLQAHFLFGPFANAVIYITATALVFAVVGNLHMVYTTLRNRGAAAILHDIDQAARNVRSQGFPKWDRFVVRAVIFTIIYIDIISRLHLFDGAIFIHAALGATLLLLFPFTYLFHMVYNVLALFYSARRRATRTVA